MIRDDSVGFLLTTMTARLKNPLNHYHFVNVQTQLTSK